MNVRKRKGEGGNASRDPRLNKMYQDEYKKKFKKTTKKCTGVLHYGADEIPITQFRQQKGNKSTGLQSRCDLCNRLYFSILQKPIKRVAAICIWAEQSGEFDWRQDVPSTLKAGIEEALDFWKSFECGVQSCTYPYQHAGYRETAARLTKIWSGLERGPKDGQVLDNKTGVSYPAPLFMQQLQEWASSSGKLTAYYELAWDWWCDLLDQDTAYDSAENRIAQRSKGAGKAAGHPLSDFPWGSGNILDTIQGHSAPGFNQVKSSARTLKMPSNASSRVYSYLVEGDRLRMMELSKKCKEMGLSLGHSPAPLRWLGKDDPINGKPEDLQENIVKSDSLIDLYTLAKSDLKKAADCVSWQIRDLLISLNFEKISFEEFTQVIERAVEEYLDSLIADSSLGEKSTLYHHIVRADPGKTITVYNYRHKKVATWLVSRPSASKK